MTNLTVKQIKTIITTNEFILLLKFIEPRTLYRRHILTDPDYTKIRSILYHYINIEVNMIEEGVGELSEIKFKKLLNKIESILQEERMKQLNYSNIGFGSNALKWEKK